MNSISIVCPTYNSADFIENALLCLKNQTKQPYEIIFCDDGSTDTTLEILTRWKSILSAGGSHVKILPNTHMGPGFTRNSGINAATGEWVSFLDSDDLWDSKKIEAVSEVIEKNPDINTIVHWENYKRADVETKIILKHGSAYNLHGNLPSQIYKENRLSTSAMTCKRELLVASGLFDPSLPVSQDYELWLRMSPSIKLNVIEDVLGSYVETANSITTRFYLSRYIPFVRILLRHRKKGGWSVFFVRLFRATFSPQWIRSSINLFLRKNAHS